MMTPVTTIVLVIEAASDTYTRWQVRFLHLKTYLFTDVDLH